MNSFRSGSTMVKIILLVVMIIAGGAIWFYALFGRTDGQSTTTNSSGQSSNTNTETLNTNIPLTTLPASDQAQLDTEIPNAPTVATSGDLDSASNVLDSLDLNANDMDSTELNGYLGEF